MPTRSSTSGPGPDAGDIREYLWVTRELTRLSRADPIWSAPLHLQLLAAQHDVRRGVMEPAEFSVVLHHLRQACATHPNAFRHP